MKVEFTKLSSKGQVVIPKNIRKKLNIDEGMPLIVTENNNSVIIKKVEIPKSWKEASAPFREVAKKSGFSKEDLMNIIREIRAAKR